MKRAALLQSNYIPWKGVFDMMNMVDVFVFYDDVQFTKQDWRSRNRIKTVNGPTYLTVPCGKTQRRLINEVELHDHKWQQQHWKTILFSYSKAPYFHLYRPFLEDFYLSKQWSHLSQMNQYFSTYVAKEIFNIPTTFLKSEDIMSAGAKGERVLSLMKEIGTTHYLSGPAAKDYLDEDLFEQENIVVEWMDYSGYKEYEQMFPPFDHYVSVIDLLVHTGPSAKEYMLSFTTP